MKPITRIDGYLLYHSVVAGAKSLIQNQNNINKINVFPVPDGDTGSNMASTMRSIIDHSSPNPSFARVMRQISDGALEGSRGNSGTILAQFLHGLAAECPNITDLSTGQWGTMLGKAVPYVYSALSEPQEGTILSVITAWCQFIEKESVHSESFESLFQRALPVARTALERTPEQLAVLRSAKVVDAGAKGFMVFIEALSQFFIKQQYQNLNLEEEEYIPQELLDEHALHGAHVQSLNELTYRYCTEGFIHGKKCDPDIIRQSVQNLGDSIVVAGSTTKIRVHIHTNNPALVFERLHPFGELTYQKAEDMLKQYEVAHARKHKIALVTDSLCTLDKSIIDQHQIHVVPVNVAFGENNYLDDLTLHQEQAFERLKTTNSYPITSQPTERSISGLLHFLSSYYDSIICVTISSTFSGTYHAFLNSAALVMQESHKKVSVIDSLSNVGGAGLLTLRIAEAIASGTEHDQILKFAEYWKPRTDILLHFDTLFNLIRSGRLGSTNPVKKFVLTALAKCGLRAHVRCYMGTNTVVAKSMGTLLSMRKLYQHVEYIKRNNIIRNYAIQYNVHKHMALSAASKLTTLLGKPPVSISPTSPANAVHGGPGALALCFMYE